MKSTNPWLHFKECLFYNPELDFYLDYSKVTFDPALFSSDRIQRALMEMDDLEAGSIANRDEQRMVGHYWLRTPRLAPSTKIAESITTTFQLIKEFCKKIHSGEIGTADNCKFESALIVGIGGSALGPQFVGRALGRADDPIKLFYFDNTDPAGMDDVLSRIPNLKKTLVIVISKSGGTKETRNGQLVAMRGLRDVGVVNPARNFVAITSEGSELDKVSKKEGWLAQFPMWDWVGGRTSELSAVGLLPAALQGIDIDGLLDGASRMDALTRSKSPRENPAAILALMWWSLTKGIGAKDMVILPYSDRLELLSRYLQQLVMESLGKELDRDGKAVLQGISVYGNKGSTDQHAYVQQLREGVLNFFAVFVEVIAHGVPSGSAAAMEVESGVTAADYLSGFLYGTRQALAEKGRESITLTIGSVSPKSVGMLIALFERAVGLYASFVNVNAYHQPGVEAGKKAATNILELQKKVAAYQEREGGAVPPEQIAKGLGVGEEQIELIYTIQRRLK
jgi:glucose-6-phosphate isomerase